MRKLIADIYKIVYKKTKNKLISLSFALAYITALNLLTIYGLCVLLSEVLPYSGLVLRLFSRPFIYAVVVIAFALNFWMMLPLQNLSLEKSRPHSVGPIVLYSFIALLLFLYSHYASAIF